MDRKKQIQILILLIFLVIVINYEWMDSWLINSLEDNKLVKIDRVIDGDTVKVNGTSIRLLGINAPEKGEIYSEEATKFLEQEVWNKKVRLEYGKDKTDLYGRELAYLISEGQNINLKLVEQGFANYYFPSGKDMYYNEFQEAWKTCIENNKNLCEKSLDKCANCIKLKKLDCNTQEVILENVCDFGCDLEGWEIKDEGRKKFYFPELILYEEIKIKVGEGEDNSAILHWKGHNYIWTKTGDTLFLRDNKGKLVLWESY